MEVDDQKNVPVSDWQRSSRRGCVARGSRRLRRNGVESTARAYRVVISASSESSHMSRERASSISFLIFLCVFLFARLSRDDPIAMTLNGTLGSWVCDDCNLPTNSPLSPSTSTHFAHEPRFKTQRSDNSVLGLAYQKTSVGLQPEITNLGLPWEAGHVDTTSGVILGPSHGSY